MLITFVVLTIKIAGCNINNICCNKCYKNNFQEFMQKDSKGLNTYF